LKIKTRANRIRAIQFYFIVLAIDCAIQIDGDCVPLETEWIGF